MRRPCAGTHAASGLSQQAAGQTQAVTITIISIFAPSPVLPCHCLLEEDVLVVNGEQLAMGRLCGGVAARQQVPSLLSA